MAILATLTIAMDDKGHVSVTGPIENTMFCYGLLEIAKDVLRTTASAPTERNIQAPAARDVLVFGAKQ